MLYSSTYYLYFLTKIHTYVRADDLVIYLLLLSLSDTIVKVRFNWDIILEYAVSNQYPGCRFVGAGVGAGAGADCIAMVS